MRNMLSMFNTSLLVCACMCFRLSRKCCSCNRARYSEALRTRIAPHSLGSRGAQLLIRGNTPRTCNGYVNTTAHWHTDELLSALVKDNEEKRGRAMQDRQQPRQRQIRLRYHGDTFQRTRVCRRAQAQHIVDTDLLGNEVLGIRLLRAFQCRQRRANAAVVFFVGLGDVTTHLHIPPLNVHVVRTRCFLILWCERFSPQSRAHTDDEGCRGIFNCSG